MREKTIFNFIALVIAFLCANPNIHKVLGQDQQNPLLSYEVIYNWQQLDYAFDSLTTKQEWIKSEKFIPKNNIITGIKVSDKTVFLTVPRWRKGVPATLVNLPLTTDPTPAYQNVTNSPPLIPYPSWEMNQIGNCSAFQYIQSMEIDQYHRMWVLDVGRVNIMEKKPDNKCPPKLVLLDIKTNKTLQTYEFPEGVVNRTSSFLNDIVVGCTSKKDCWAYISDVADAKIVVYNHRQNRSWFVKHPSMLADPKAVEVSLQGENYNIKANVDGIALSPIDTNFSRLFFTPVSSFEIFSVATGDLKNVGASDNINGTNLEDSVVKNHGRKSSQTDGMIIDSSGLLYFGLLGGSAVNSWNTSYANLTSRNQPLLVQNDIDLQWPDTFSIDEQGYVFVTTNKIPRYNKNELDFDEINFRVIRFFVGLKSYMYSKKDMVGQTSLEPESEPEPEAEAETIPEPESAPEPEPTTLDEKNKPVVVHNHDNKTRYDVDHQHPHDHDEHNDNTITGKSQQVHQASSAYGLYGSLYLVLSIFSLQVLIFCNHHVNQ